ncbi:hypothetical protein MMC21_003956 [Puttea exsequens]|nr:hypothetical protein [Puttea exsequens]
MPIRWSSEVDQILLLKILETSEINVNAASISATWPAGMEKPTARAITERLVKIRANCKGNGSGTSSFSISRAGITAAGTPRKRYGSDITKSSTPSKTSTKTRTNKDKRKRTNCMIIEDSSDNDEEDSDFKTPITSVDSRNGSPSKKARGASVAKFITGDEVVGNGHGGLGNGNLLGWKGMLEMGIDIQMEEDPGLYA